MSIYCTVGKKAKVTVTYPNGDRYTLKGATVSVESVADDSLSGDTFRYRVTFEYEGGAKMKKTKKKKRGRRP